MRAAAAWPRGSAAAARAPPAAAAPRAPARPAETRSWPGENIKSLRRKILSLYGEKYLVVCSAARLGAGELVHDDGAGEELAPPHVLLHAELLLPLPVTRDPEHSEVCRWIEGKIC